MFAVIFQWIGALLFRLRWLIGAILAIGLPLYIYLACIATEPVFGPEQDVNLGRMSEQSIAEDPEQFPPLPRDEYPEAYAHLERVVDGIIDSPEIQYRDLFAYDDMKIINRDDVLNAFCTPGGFIYVYTGLIKYLDAEDHLAGVLGHEIAHAEMRHSSTRLQKEFGTNALLNFILLTTPVGISDVVNARILRELSTLDYSRGQEAQADDYSVRYLASSDYACDGTAGFFRKLLDQGQDINIPEFLSDHPDSAARVRDVEAAARELGCSTELADASNWTAFQASLPANESDETTTIEESKDGE
jgi:predicted Zn-dependent protease